MRNTACLILVTAFLLSGLVVATETTGDRTKLRHNIYRAQDHTQRRTMRAQDKISRMGAQNPARAKNLRFVPGRLLVKYKSGKFRGDVENALKARHKIKKAGYIRFADIHIYHVGAESRQGDTLRGLRAESAIQYAEPDYLLHADAVPDDPEFSKMWGMHNTGQSGGKVNADIDAPEAWDLSTGSGDVVVAVLDTGIDYTHPDLAANMWQNGGEIAGDGIDNDGNGFIDDIYGIDAYNGDSDPMDDGGHGTHAAGTIGAVGNNTVGTAGVNRNVKLMGLKFLSYSGWGPTSAALVCIQYAIDNGAHIINASFTNYNSYADALKDAMAEAGNHGILIVASAGNNSRNVDIYDNYPATFDLDNIMAVNASDHNDHLAATSNYGAARIDIAAPGVSIYSTLPGNGYGYKDGTSIAAPYVTGVAALLKAYVPGITNAEIKARIIANADHPADLNGKNASNGRLNAYYTLKNIPAPTVEITAPATGTFVSGTVTVTAEAADINGVTAVEFYIDGILKTTLNTPPYQYDWDTTAYTNSNHRITVTAANAEGRKAEYEIFPAVNNTGAPAVFIKSPVGDADLKHTVSVEVEAGYEAGILKVELLADNVKIAEDSTAPYVMPWNTLGLTNGAHTLKAVVHAADGLTAETSVSVNVANVYLPQAERDALIAVYNATGGDFWWYKSNWKKADGSFNDPGSENTWAGVFVYDGHVKYLYLDDNNLSGTLPPEIGNFSELRELFLYYNYLTGPLPEAIGNLSKLNYLDLDYNYITGPFPSGFGNMVNLRELWMNENQFNSPLPASIGNMQKLQYLYAWYAKITGPLPPEIGNMTALEDLDLSENHITGPLPEEIGNLSNLYWLYLYENRMSGPLPATIGNLKNLYTFYIQDNLFSGPIPPEMGDMENLHSVCMGSSKYSGSLPVELLKLSDTTFFNLSYNALHTDNEHLRQFISNRDSDWDRTQTVAPANIKAKSASPTAVTLTWDPIPYTSRSGGYHIYMGTAPGGPHTEVGATLSKSDNAYTVTGLTAGTAYYFVIKSRTDFTYPSPYQLFSEPSPEISGIILDHYTLTAEVSPGTGAAITVSPADTNGDGDGVTAFSRTYTSGTTVTLTAPATHEGVDFSHWMINGVRTETLAATVEIRNNVTACAYYSAPTIRVVYPNGGETLRGGTSLTIRWLSESIAGTVDIAYSVNGAAGPFTPITAATPNDGSFTWNVPDTPSDQYMIRVSETDGTVSDLSDAAFGVEETPKITVTAPNGGEIIPAGSTYTITWTASAGIGNVTIAYSRTGYYGFYRTVAADIANTGTHEWTVPADTDSASCYIRIRATNADAADTNNASFSIRRLISTAERQALMDFYNSTGGDSWTNNTNWKAAPLHTDGFSLPGTEAGWHGVTTENGHVTALYYYNNNLTGTLPASLGSLTYMTNFQIRIATQLTGAIPAQLGDLTALTCLKLEHTGLTGGIPAAIGALVNLRQLYITYNTDLGGVIPAEIGNLVNLEYLSLNNCGLTGAVPAAVGNLVNILKINLSANQLTDAVPPELGNLTRCNELHLGNNQLNGEIPPELGNMTALQYLYLYLNQLNGAIPAQLGQLSNLRTLALHYNQLSGAIPTELFAMPALSELNLSKNQLSGAIPAEVGGASYLNRLFLNNNALSGAIPPELGNLSRLTYLHLNGNALSGEVPAAIVNLTVIPANMLNIGYNGLYCTDNAVKAYLDTRDPDWAGTQTIAPTAVAAAGASSTSVRITWTPIAFTGETGGYRVYYATNEGGPYTESGVTLNKSANAYTVTGLTTGTVHYFVVRSETSPHTENANTLQSEDSAEVSAVAATPTLLITSPNGAESFPTSSYQTITWQGGVAGFNVGLEYSTTGIDGPYTTIISATPNDGSYSWYAPNIHSHQCVIRISQTVESISDTSDGVFSLIMPASLTVTAPNGGETFTEGDTMTITWTHTGDVGNVKLEYAVDGLNGSYTTITDSTANNGVYQWTVPDIDSTDCAIRISETDGDPSDKSDALFTVTPLPGITVTSPNGGETLTAGDTHTITWTSTGSVGNLDIAYSSAGPNGTFIPIVSNTADNGSHSWTVPDVDSNQCILRITETGGTLSDSSDTAFTITPTPTLTVTAPNGGETLSTGDTVSITWNAVSITGTIAIHLFKEETQQATIGSVNVDAGTFSWTIPYALAPGTRYRIRIAQGEVNDFSDADFTLHTAPNRPDFNGDGHADILWRNTATGKNAVWYMDNAVRTGIALPMDVPNTDWHIAAAADFNMDGKPDILWRNNAIGKNAVWYMDNATRIGIAIPPDVPNTDWHIAAAADFNMDGKPDILWRHTTTGKNAIWYMDNATRIGIAFPPDVPNLDWHIAGTADFNKDGKTDILWHNTANGKIALWYMDDTTRTGIALPPAAPNLKWIPAAVADFDNDGCPDILWRDTDTGQNILWLMNDHIHTGTAYPPATANTDWKIVN